MNSILVLYPIQPYADVLMGKREFPDIKVKYAQIYQNLLNKRYPGYQIIWMMFSNPQSAGNPDLTQLWQGISLEEEDIVGSCGVTFKEHCGRKTYPDPKVVLKACP